MLQPCPRNVGLAGFLDGTSGDHGSEEDLLTLGKQRCKYIPAGKAVAIGLWRLLRMIMGCGRYKILCFSRCILGDGVKSCVSFACALNGLPSGRQALTLTLTLRTQPGTSCCACQIPTVKHPLRYVCKLAGLDVRKVCPRRSLRREACGNGSVGRGFQLVEVAMKPYQCQYQFHSEHLTHFIQTFAVEVPGPENDCTGHWLNEIGCSQNKCHNRNKRRNIRSINETKRDSFWF